MMIKFLVSLVKKLVALALLGGVIAVVAYAMVKPETPPETRDRPGRNGAATPARGGGAPTVPVLAARAESTNVPVVVDVVGTVRPLKTVTVRPQVDGRIEHINFKEGQDVKAGDLLAQLDPATYQAALDQAIAKRAITETQLANARRDYERMAKIPGVIAQKTMDTQKAQVQQFEAQLKADDAAIANARTILGYTHITAPISGRTGFRLVDEGNLVRSGDAGIVTITTLDPISVVFTVPQQRLADLRNALQGYTTRNSVEVIDSNGKPFGSKGTLDVIDNQIDPQTGTVKVKATFPNSARLLWPGQFVNVKVTVSVLERVTAVPTAAVQRGPAGTFVWLVGADNKAVVRPVEAGLQTETLTVIKKGLNAGDQVVTTGFARISEGARLVIRDAPAAAPVSFAPPPRAKRGGNRGKSKVQGNRPGQDTDRTAARRTQGTAP
ncbi:MAG: efflux RND transporter periplasmic adaptor subunit [Hyphomicrobiaceae bacterium]